MKQSTIKPRKARTATFADWWGRLLSLCAFLFLMLLLMPSKAVAQVYGCVYDSSTHTMTFKDCSAMSSDSYARINNNESPSNLIDNFNASASDVERVVFEDSFIGYEPTSCFYYFWRFTSLKQIEGLENLNTSKVTNMDAMFDGCSSLTSLDLSRFNTEKVTDMSSMFSECSSLVSLNLSSFNTAKVTNMSYMFFDCNNLVNITFGNHFDTSNVTNMSLMFYYCNSLVSLDLTGFDTHNVTDMNMMFYKCYVLENLVLGDKFDTSNVTNMSSMFSYCKELTSLDLSGFNTECVTNMSRMFMGCYKLASINFGKHFDTSNVTNMESMFRMCSPLKSLDLSGFNTKNVTNMSSLFSDCEALTSIDFGDNFDTSNVTNMGYMFRGCTSLETLNLTGFDTRKVEDMSQMFKSYNFAYKMKLKNIYVSDMFSTESVTSDADMFLNCDNLPNFDSNSVDKTRAHYKDGGYLVTYYKIGNEMHPISGDVLTAENLELIDGEDFFAYKPFTAETATYNRTIADGTNWNSLCLPFEVSLEGQNFRAFKLLSATDNAVELEELETSIAAGTPVIIKMNEGATALNITAQDQAVAKEVQDGSSTDNGGLQLVGLYTKKMFSKDTDNDCYILKANKLMNPAKILEKTSTKTVGSRSFRAYMKEKGQPSGAPRMYSLSIGSEETALDMLQNDNDAHTEYYDLQGNLLTAPQKGVNILRRGGKTMKVIIR